VRLCLYAKSKTDALLNLCARQRAASSSGYHDLVELEKYAILI